MAGDGLGIIEGLPLPGDSPVLLMAGNFIDETMNTHEFCHIHIVLVAMDKERVSVDNLPEICGTAKFLIGEVGIDIIAGNVLWSVPPLLYEGLTIDTVIVHGDDSGQNAEPSFHGDNLACVVDGLLHFKHKGGCL